MKMILLVLTLFFSLALIILVTIQPRRLPFLSQDSTSQIGRVSFWRSDTVVKALTLVSSISLFVLLLLLMILNM